MDRMKSLVHDYLSSAQIMQLITSYDNQGWGASVYFAFDENLNIYWLSRPERRHSQELLKNPKVAGVVVKFHTYGEKVRGLQFEGIAEQLSGEDAEYGMRVYEGRYTIPRARVTNIGEGFSGERHVIYRIKPTFFVLFDEVNFPENPRQELRLV